MEIVTDTFTKGEATRAQLIAAAMELVHTEGVGSITARRLADKVGLKRQIVHYYFGTIDDVLIEVMRTGFRIAYQAIATQLLSRDPIDVIWDQFSSTTPESAEFLALALRKETFGNVAREFAHELHRLFGDAIASDYQRRGLDPPAHPAALALILQATSQALGWEAALGFSSGHEQAKATLNALLGRN
ncbi:TetR/AcrR family transcriptional regulator [Sphingomonas solaris]|nr:TetR family transcriptional regulator [Sphingomonas solaris]